MDPKVVKRLMATEDGKYLKEFLAKKVIELDSVREIKSTLTHEIALEVRSRIHAQDTLMEILSQLISVADIKTPEEKESEYGM